MNISEFTQSSSGLLKKEDIGKARPKVMIERVDITEFDGTRKLVLHFQGKEKGLSLNKTNTQILALAYGDESDGWLGQIVELWVDPYVTYAGKMVGGIKVQPTQSAPKPMPVVQPSADDSDIPF